MLVYNWLSRWSAEKVWFLIPIIMASGRECLPGHDVLNSEPRSDGQPMSSLSAWQMVRAVSAIRACPLPKHNLRNGNTQGGPVFIVDQCTRSSQASIRKEHRWILRPFPTAKPFANSLARGGAAEQPCSFNRPIAHQVHDPTDGHQGSHFHAPSHPSITSVGKLAEPSDDTLTNTKKMKRHSVHSIKR